MLEWQKFQKIENGNKFLNWQAKVFQLTWLENNVKTGISIILVKIQEFCWSTDWPKTEADKNAKKESYQTLFRRRSY